MSRTEGCFSSTTPSLLAARGLLSTGPETARRRLADGREFNIIKRWFQLDTLTAELALLGWELHLTETANGFFVLGCGSRSQTDA